MRRLLIAFVVFAACASQKPGKAPAASEKETAGDVLVPTLPERPADLIDAGLESPAATSEEPSASKSDINARFLDEDLNVERWRKTFEVESREVYAARKDVISALKILPGQSVVDIGAGTGFYLWDFAEAVGPSGHAYGVEISPRFLERLRKHVAANKLANTTIVTGSTRSIELADNSVDLVFICDTYHHFEYPQVTLASIRRALRPGGALVIIDFHRIEGTSPKWLLEHVRAGQGVFRQEIEAAGFAFEEDLHIAGFSENYMMRFRNSD